MSRVEGHLYPQDGPFVVESYLRPLNPTKGGVESYLRPLEATKQWGSELLALSQPYKTVLLRATFALVPTKGGLRTISQPLTLPTGGEGT